MRRSEWPSTTPWTSISVAGVGAARRLVHVLGEDLDARAARGVDHRLQVRVRNADRHVDAVGAVHPRQEGLDVLLGLRHGLVHLPVAGDEGRAGHLRDEP
jgi:hypothetical protein